MMLKQRTPVFEFLTGLVTGIGFLLAVARMGTAADPAQKSFATPDQAAQELLRVAEAGDKAAALQLFGPEGGKIISSGDPVQDRNHRETFVANAKTYMKADKDPMNPDRAFILIGEDHHPFVVPLVRTGSHWRFDTKAGKDELLARRIGSNELDAIAAAEAYVAAQREYAQEDRTANGVHEYAQRLISTPGKQDGLFWRESAGGPVSPLSIQVRKAMAEGYTKKGNVPTPYHGYYFRILKGQGPHAAEGPKDYVVRGLMIGGFGLVAWPAEYGVSGIKTFVVNQEGVVYEKDLGPGTAKAAQVVTRFNPDKTWGRAN